MQNTLGIAVKTAQRYEGIQCLRAVAALLVMWAHFKFSSNSSLLNYPMIQTSAGSIGVDVFFVISGFVIALTASKINNSWRTFIIHRIARVVPLYYLTSIYFAVYIINHYGFIPHQALNTLIFIPLFNINDFANPYHPFGWTICFEIWFYIAFATSLIFAKSLTIKIFPVAFMIASALVLTQYNGKYVLPSFLFHPLVLEFCAGIYLYRARNFFGKPALFLFIAASISSAFLVLDTEKLGYHTEVLSDPSLGALRALIWGGFSLFLVGTFIALDNCKVKWPHTFTHLGDASYSLYLIQPYTLKLASKLTTYSEIEWLGPLLFTLFTLSAALILHHLIEKPLTKLCRTHLEKVIGMEKDKTRLENQAFNQSS
ncbi:MAG: acyltransferase [Spongiibacteraceae bacterium]